MRRIALSVTLAAALAMAAPTSGLGWGFPGHGTVGAIADIVLKRDNPELYERIQDVLGGKTLREVAIYPDCIFVHVDGCPNATGFTDYVKRNPLHGEYHFTDIPFQRKRYVAGTGSTHPRDVVADVAGFGLDEFADGVHSSTWTKRASSRARCVGRVEPESKGKLNDAVMYNRKLLCNSNTVSICE